MKKNEPKRIAFENVSEELAKEIIEVVEQAAKHRYSTAKVYKAHNAVFLKSEKPSSCGSCIRRKARELRSYLSEFKTWAQTDDADAVIDIDLLSREELVAFIAFHEFPIIVVDEDTEEDIRDMIDRYNATNKPQSRPINVLKLDDTDEDGTPKPGHKTDEEIEAEKTQHGGEIADAIIEQQATAAQVELEDGTLVTIDPETSIATNDDGKKIKAGTHPIKGGKELLVVTVKGTATVKPDESNDII